jgi:chromate reductase
MCPDRTPFGPADVLRPAASARGWAQTFGVMRVFAISGSLRAASINSALLRAAERLSPPEVEVRLFRTAGELPLFNPDLEAYLPPQVARLHAEIADSDALLIASPEYAHGVTGTIKNALDWLVSFEPFINKPVAVLNASPRAHHADGALRETLRTMSAVIVEEASISIPLLGAHLMEDGMFTDPTVSRVIRSALVALHRAVVLRQSEQSPSFTLR